MSEELCLNGKLLIVWGFEDVGKRRFILIVLFKDGDIGYFGVLRGFIVF